jgi:low temperature requirement protein LtrA
MFARSADEEHRAATALELFFDLCFVVAIALAASSLHHEIIEGHIGDGVLSYVLVFFAIWWAWMNFTWFASAYDTDDVLYRLMTFVQMSGVLVLAAGVPKGFEHGDIVLITAGYVVMRLAMVGQWLRAAHADLDHRPCALRYAIGIAVLQCLWVGRLLLPESLNYPSIIILILAELAVPVWAEKSNGTTWHPQHITERYGLFTIIVLGETILAATTALQTAFDAGHADASLIAVAIGGLVIVFSLWWLSFEVEENRLLDSHLGSFVYGYGHLFVFASAAAVGAAMEVVVEHDTGHGELGDFTVGLVIAVPVALYIAGVWVLRILPNTRGIIRAAYPACAIMILGFAGLGAPVPITAAFLAALVAVLIFSNSRLEGAPVPDSP